MYHVELLPTTSTHLTPGWTYVPDRGLGPAKANIAPTVGRKRGIRDPGGRGDLTSRQNNAIVRHLAELDRENHRDVHIPIPVKQKDATRGTRGKVTPNVRRILQSQKTFRNYLDDEEAAQAQGTQAVPAARPPPSKVTKPAQRSMTPAMPKPESASARRKRTQATQPSTTTSETPSAAPAPEGSEETETKPKNQLIKSEYDNDPLLRSYIPSAPSDRIMQALLAEPPLTYHASRAGPPLSTKSQRRFCYMCGYWGKIRCKNCGVRTCGLECYKVHEDSRCGAFF